ncbi:M48 family metalloprotease [Bowmanella denitrificans]|uniref:M48 family metalloprotease n=1 Tax=Bowmanella denitrificans TaxID=366582 RepID=A0ABN0X0D2_9ALTE
MPYRISLLLFFAASQFLSGCATNPATGDAEFVTMSESRELEIGEEMHKKILETQPIYEDEKVTAYVNQVGQALAKVGERPELTYHFTVLDNPQINAFALPGGYIYVNRGLLAYMHSEAQLAAVLAHELGHVTARHAVRQDTARTGAQVLSVMSVLATGSWAVGDAASLWSSAAVMGYGREMELEADGLGARYLSKAGYSPHAMIEVISTLKDQEKFTRHLNAKTGRQQTYHGLFSTHPRNDTRLREVVDKAAELEKHTQVVEKDPAEFRSIMDGLVYGPSYRRPDDKKDDEDNRFTHNRLGFSVIFPDDWQVTNAGHTIIAEAPDKSALMHMEVTRRQEELPPGNYLRKYYDVPLLMRSEDFSQAGMLGHTGIRPADDKLPQPSRVAIFYRGSLIYMLQGEVHKPDPDTDYDKLFLDSIHSFAPERGTAALPKPKTINYVQAEPGTTFAGIARSMRIGRYAEEQLRLINGYYPSGEPKEGEWLKIIR